jgi:hypothetical protein
LGIRLLTNIGHWLWRGRQQSAGQHDDSHEWKGDEHALLDHLLFSSFPVGWSQ